MSDRITTHAPTSTATNTTTIPSRAWYGDIDLTLQFPERWQVHTLWPHDAPALTEAEIAAAFANPIGMGRISEMARGRRSAAIIVDDLSRPTPAATVVQYVLAELNEAGVPKSEIRFVVGGGSHRPLTQEEIAKKVGADVAAEYQVTSHDFMAGNLTGIGSLPDGTPLYFDPIVAASDFKMTIGGIYPHGAVGFGGGSKLVLPGVAGFATMFHFHSFYPSRGQGIIENPTNIPDHRDASEAAARALGLDMVVNMVLTSHRQPAGLFVGDFVKAQRAGAHFARKTYGTRIPEDLRGKADVVVVNAYPLDSDAIQSGKARWATRHFPNAYNVVVNPASDGVCYHGLFDRINWGRFEAQIKARLGSPEPESRLDGRDHALVWSENFPVEDFARKQPNDVLVRKWETVVDLLAEKVPADATVVVFPSSGIQILAAE